MYMYVYTCTCLCRGNEEFRPVHSPMMYSSPFLLSLPSPALLPHVWHLDHHLLMPILVVTALCISDFFIISTVRLHWF